MMLRALTALSAICLVTACAQTGAPRTAAVETAKPISIGDPWFDEAQQRLAARKAVQQNRNKAKNVILFVADGMDIATITATRIYDGQSRNEDGESNVLSFERFPHLALSKTYTTDYQVADSAGTMSAMVTGVKTKSGVLSITDAAERGDCAGALANPAVTLGELAEKAGMAVGVISTAAITHATPAAVYAHAADRGWAVDTYMPDEARAAGCTDIAAQLIDFPYGDGIDLVLGGGRSHFLPSTMQDPEDADAVGRRGDGRDLTAAWTEKSADHTFVWNEADFETALDTAKILGLFEQNHMEFEADRAGDTGGEPSLARMTERAIEMLGNDKDGFFLVVEGGRVDHAHHGGNAYRALTDAQEYAEAVAVADRLTSDDDTLIIVTADHGHTMSIAGYPARGNPILGLASVRNELGALEPIKAAVDEKPYTTLGYMNGPGTVLAPDADLSGGRAALTPEAVSEHNFRQQALVPTGSETHGGQDVAIFASGPKAYLIDGVVEQNYIFHVINDALGLMTE